MKDVTANRDKVTAYLGLGSNMGDRRGNIMRSLELLEAHGAIEVTGVSGFFETDPVGYLDQDDFINAAAGIKTSLTPMELLGVIQEIETRLGRERNIRFGPRTIDMDILLFGKISLSLPELEIPHPRMTERAFVLLPLMDVAPDNILPGASLEALAQKCDSDGVRKL